MTAPAEVTLGPAAIPHLRNLIAACRAGRRENYDGGSVDWAEQIVRDLTPEVPLPRDLSGLDDHLDRMHGTFVHRFTDYQTEHAEQHRRWADGVDPEMVAGGIETYQPHTHPQEPR